MRLIRAILRGIRQWKRQVWDYEHIFLQDGDDPTPDHTDYSKEIREHGLR